MGHADQEDFNKAVGVAGASLCFCHPHGASVPILVDGRRGKLSFNSHPPAHQPLSSLSPPDLLPVPHRSPPLLLQPAPLPTAGLASGAALGHAALPPCFGAWRHHLSPAVPPPNWAGGSSARLCCRRLHTCAPGLAGMAPKTPEAVWAGTFSPLELSERRLERLHEGVICRILRVRGPFLHFVRSPASEILPTSDPAARRERIPLSPEFHAQTLFPRDFPTEPLPSASPPAFYWSEKRVGLGQECRLLLASSPLPPFSAHGGASDVPFSTLREPLTDEELLQAGIQASLQDMTEEEVKLSKSSVSSLRLQQLQKMGFPTEQAVVALAASGHVEGAVSLLIGGHVGDKAMVTADSRSAHR
ncbi:rhomboid domain-containing protein 3 isoform X3 [Rhineura floridana]|uniref:rhomboid domain-containing protein 3 isoform X3 n=1 Tax=Rhineura floridana TaxID=261503 RepID=UPI002AC7EC69|nr:rhomboid domain-containing protein 3 isoform X3 [Rhineura floridana]